MYKRYLLLRVVLWLNANADKRGTAEYVLFNSVACWLYSEDESYCRACDKANLLN